MGFDYKSLKFSKDGSENKIIKIANIVYPPK